MLRPIQPPAFIGIGSLCLSFVLGSAGAFGQAKALDESSRALYRGDYKRASELATAHLQKSPNDVSVRVILARAEIAEAEFEKAFADLRKALILDPKNIDALFYLSLIAKELSQEESRRLFSLAPDSERAHQLLGEAALAAANQAAAEEEFQKALKVNPGSLAILAQLAELKRSQFKFDEAINYYSQAERIDPSDPGIAAGLGSCYTSEQEFSRATEWFQKAVALTPTSAELRYALGNALFQNSQFEAAVPELKAAIEIDPSMLEAYTLLGRAYSKLGRPEEAKAVLMKFNELNRAVMHGHVKPEGAASPEQR